MTSEELESIRRLAADKERCKGCDGTGKAFYIDRLFICPQCGGLGYRIHDMSGYVDMLIEEIQRLEDKLEAKRIRTAMEAQGRETA